MPLVAGVDCSTQATKVLIVDDDSGEVVAEGRAPHEVHADGATSESHPDTWWTALADALAQTGRARDVRAISIDGQQHGLVLLDDAGHPLRPAPLWNDVRSAPDAERLTEALGARWWAMHSGSVPVASFTVSKWAWLRRTGSEALDRTRTVALPHDYVTLRLTDEHVTDRGDASGTGWWSPHDGDYLEEVLEHPLVGLSRSALPRVAAPTEAVGEVTSAAAEATGLTAGTVVGPGTGDNMAAALGLGVGAGQPVISLGTSGTAYVVSTAPTADATGTLAGFASADGRFLPLAATLNCTRAVDLVASWLALDRDDVAFGDVAFLPWFDGERTPNVPDATGSIVGLRGRTTRQEILGGAYVGATASLLDAIDLLADASSGVAADAPLTMTGGGARGAAWIETFRHLTSRPLRVAGEVETAALGAAVQAAAVRTGRPAADVRAAWPSVIDREVDGRGDRAQLRERLRTLRESLIAVWKDDGFRHA